MGQPLRGWGREPGIPQTRQARGPWTPPALSSAVLCPGHRLGLSTRMSSLGMAKTSPAKCFLVPTGFCSGTPAETHTSLEARAPLGLAQSLLPAPY